MVLSTEDHRMSENTTKIQKMHQEWKIFRRKTNLTLFCSIAPMNRKHKYFREAGIVPKNDGTLEPVY